MSKSRNKKCRSESFGVYGARVRVAERVPGGILSLLWVNAAGKQQKRSLGHRDWKRARSQALELATRLASYNAAEAAGLLTLDRLVHLYLKEGLHGRSSKHRRETKQRLKLVVGFLGGDREVRSLTPSDVERYKEARLSGSVRPAGRKRDGGVRYGTVWHDLVALNRALNWAAGHRDPRGRQLLAANPLAGVRLPREVSPAQPVADQGRYLALKAVAPRIGPSFELALTLAFETGHRIGAILQLRWEDISFEKTSEAPYGRIHWRGEYDKVGNDHVTPMNEATHYVLIRALRSRGSIAGGLVFPSAGDPNRPVDRHLASRWLRKAEKLAELEHLPGGGWHAFRRGWATARKGYPLKDVAAAGGWKDTASLLKCYQHADERTVYRVIAGASEESYPKTYPTSEEDESPDRANAVEASS